jgi:hypothetical protein
MPTFIDYHAKLPAIPREQAKEMAAGVKAGRRDDYDVKPLNVFIGNGEGFCLTEAPDKDAVVASHKALGFPLRKADVHQVTPLV